MEKIPSIPFSEFEFSFVRSSGPGGQNVNKVNSKAVLRWNFNASQVLTEEQRARIALKLANQLTVDGDLVVMSDRFRDQGRNKEDCIEKFYAMITQAMHKPKTQKKSKPTYSSKVKKKESKKRHSEKKQNRRFQY